MRMTTIKTSETSASALVHRLYPTLTESERQQAETALLKANPHLSDSDAFKPGAVVTLPDTPTLKPKATASSDDPLAVTLDLLNDTLKIHQENNANRIDTALANLAVQEETLKNREIAAAIKSTPEADELVKDLAASLKTARKRLAEDKKTQDALFSRIAEDLSTLFK
jgi:phage tail protein X